MVKSALVGGCFFALTGVALGAMGAHALKESIPADRLAIFETAVRYQVYHALALLAMGLAAAASGSQLLRAAIVLFQAGILIFSGSLYALSLSGTTFFGAITPIGGFCFLLGWVLAMIHFIRQPAKA